MVKQFRNKLELFEYLMYGYSYMLEDVRTKRGVQKRLRDEELEKSLKETTKELIKVRDLSVELKLGPAYNRLSFLEFKYFLKKIVVGMKRKIYRNFIYKRNKNNRIMGRIW